VVYRVNGFSGLRGLSRARRAAIASLALGEHSSWPERDIAECKHSSGASRQWEAVESR